MTDAFKKAYPYHSYMNQPILFEIVDGGFVAHITYFDIKFRAFAETQELAARMVVGEIYTQMYGVTS